MTLIRSESQRVQSNRRGLTRRMTLVAAAVAAALGVTSAPIVRAADASAAELQTLKSQIDALQRQVERLQAQQQQQAQQQAAASSGAPAPAPPAKPAAASNAPTVHAGTVTLTFGGYMALEGVYRDRNQTADIGSNYNAGIPFDFQTNAHINEFRESARQSRFSLLATGAKVGSMSGEGYLETDFLSAGVSSNSAESNSYTLRVRNFYGELKDDGWYLLAGQSWSLATLYGNATLAPRGERVPQTIDAQYVAGFNWTRNAQIRYVMNWGKTASFGVSLESPEASIYGGCSGNASCGTVSALTTNTGGSLLNSTANYSIDYLPDVIAKVAFDPGYGHYEVYGLARSFRDRSPNAVVGGENNTTWGTSVGGGLILPFGKLVEFQLSGLAGSGNGRYGSAQLPDATIKPDGRVKAIDEWQAMAGFLFKPTPMLTIYAYAGKEQASSEAYTNAAGTQGFGYGSPLYVNTGCNLLNGTAATCIGNTKSVEMYTIGDWWKVWQGDMGNFQIGLEYSYLKRKAFDGVGGAPDADINMGFVSFRWYPYQR
jgi:hypothetical protein